MGPGLGLVWSGLITSTQFPFLLFSVVSVLAVALPADYTAHEQKHIIYSGKLRGICIRKKISSFVSGAVVVWRRKRSRQEIKTVANRSHT